MPPRLDGSPKRVSTDIRKKHKYPKAQGCPQHRHPHPHLLSSSLIPPRHGYFTEANKALPTQDPPSLQMASGSPRHHLPPLRSLSCLSHDGDRRVLLQLLRWAIHPLLALVLVSSFLPPSPSGNHPYTHQEKGLTHSYDSTH